MSTNPLTPPAYVAANSTPQLQYSYGGGSVAQLGYGTGVHAQSTYAGGVQTSSKPFNGVSGSDKLAPAGSGVQYPTGLSQQTYEAAVANMYQSNAAGGGYQYSAGNNQSYHGMALGGGMAYPGCSGNDAGIYAGGSQMASAGLNPYQSQVMYRSSRDGLNSAGYQTGGSTLDNAGYQRGTLSTSASGYQGQSSHSSNPTVAGSAGAAVTSSGKLIDSLGKLTLKDSSTPAGVSHYEASSAGVSVTGSLSAIAANTQSSTGVGLSVLTTSGTTTLSRATSVVTTKSTLPLTSMYTIVGNLNLLVRFVFSLIHYTFRCQKSKVSDAVES